MRAKTVRAFFFYFALGVTTAVLLSPSQISEVPPVAAILVATMPFAAGTLLRAPDVTWQWIGRPVDRGEIVRPAAAVREAHPKADEEARSEVYGAALRGAVSAGDPIRRSGIVKPGDRDFLEIVLSLAARAADPDQAGSAPRTVF
jgi:Flp pilus assembly protein CpaB